MDPTNDEIIVYEDAAGEWRWSRRDAQNHKIVADSGEGYVSKADAVNAAYELNPDVPAVEA